MTLLVAAETLIEETAHINSGGNFTIDYLGSCSLTAERWFSGEKSGDSHTSALHCCRKKIFKKLFSCVILRLYPEFQCPTMPGSGQKVCGGGWCVNLL